MDGWKQRVGGLVQWASRPSSIQREEVVGFFMWRAGECDLVTFPDGGHRTYCLFGRQQEDYYARIEKRLKELDAGEVRRAFAAAKQELLDASRPARETSEYSDGELASAYELFLQRFSGVSFFIVAPFVVEDKLDPFLREKLDAFDFKNAREYFDAITNPTEPIAFEELRLKLAGLVVEGNAGGERLRQVAGEFKWISEYCFIEPLAELSYFELMAAEMTVEAALEEREKFAARMEANCKALEGVAAKLPGGLARLARVVNAFVTMRTHRIDLMKQSMCEFRWFLGEVAGRLSRKTGGRWTAEHVAFLSSDEILSFLEGNGAPDISGAEERRSGRVLFAKISGKAEFSRDVKLIDAVRKAVTPEAREIRGTPASRGLAEGTVALLLSKEDLKKNFSGKVLVAKITYPDYVMKMKAAVAIVTDEGGITSHAAIVAREFGVPCVAGTRVATRELKEGDRVRVDAFKGIVTRI